jgi:hypothetical protein
MSEPCISPIIDVVVKIGLVGLGGLIGASINMYIARARLRLVIPNFISQIEASAVLCKNAFSQVEAEACISPLERAAELAHTFLAAGLSTKQWSARLTQIQAAQLAASAAARANIEEIALAAAKLRSEGAKLAEWSKSLR